MKKTILFIGILFCCCFLMANPQNPNNNSMSNENRRVFVGLSFGPTADWLVAVKDSTRSKAKTGFITGINTDISLTKKRIFYISTGLLFRYLQCEYSFRNLYSFNIKDTSIIYSTVRTYQTMYLTIPTGVRIRTAPSNGCVFSAKTGLYHNFKIVGNQFDSFKFEEQPEYNLTTKKEKNIDAVLFAESIYVGLGFEYVLKNNSRAFINVDYSCQFNYFSSKAKSNISDNRFKGIIHSLHIVFGFMF